ncbi:hypothetical protein SSX86_003932 [Deinandra increscens subsp. villosa]|uniref:BZIP domain-containing protein n=1 Tax=Deinandra increscens subsp. villosa TaxID=3103831 RepID=A0AAP0DJ98_9ASTR
MFQPSFEMENGHNVIEMSTVSNLQMIQFDENDPEVIARRIKNRERQRRYRARKRQEADSKRSRMINHPVQSQVNQTQVNTTPVNISTQTYRQHVDQTQVNDTPVNIITGVYDEQVDQTQATDTHVNIVTRVYSPRNWKKDARTAHLLKQEQQQQQNVASSTSASIDLQLSGSQLSVTVDTREHSSTPSGRNWKAEARNKRN